MKPPLFAVLAAALSLPASAGTSGRVEVVPEFKAQSGLGASGASVTPLTVTPLTLNAVLPVASVASIHGAPLAWPSAVAAANATPIKAAAVPVKAVVPTAKTFAPAAKSAAGEIGETGERKTLIQTLSAPQIDASKLGTLESAGALEADFLSRAQLGQTRSAASGAELTLGAENAGASGLLKAGTRISNLALPGLLEPKESVAQLKSAGRNWYFDAISGNGAAVTELERRLETGNGEALRALNRRLGEVAEKHGVRIDQIVSVYRYGSSVWGHKNNPAQDHDLLVVVDGELEGEAAQGSESLALKSETDSKAFLLYYNETVAPAGQKPANFTVISRAHIAEFLKNGGPTKDEITSGVGGLWAHAGHAVLIAGEDALAPVVPGAGATMYSARDIARNAGGFLDNYINKTDMRRAQSLSGASFGPRVSDEENDKLVPKVFLRLLESQLALRRAANLLEKDPEIVKSAVVGDARRTYARFFLGEHWPSLPAVTKEMSSEMIGLSNETSGLADTLERATLSAAQLARRRAEAWTTGIMLAGVVALAVSYFAGAFHWSVAAAAGLALALRLFVPGLVERLAPKPAPETMVSRQAAAELVDGFVARIGDASPKGEAAVAHARRVIALAKRGRFDDKPAVKFIVDRIAKGKSLDYNDEFGLVGDATLKDGVLTVKIAGVSHKRLPRFDKALRAGKEHNPTGANTAYAQTVYAVLKGAALKAAGDASVKTVRIEGSRLLNKDLEQGLIELGFRQELDPRWSAEVSAMLPKYYALEVPVREAGAALLDADGKGMEGALARLKAAGGVAIDLGFTPSPKSLKVLAELREEVLLYRRADGTWRVQGGGDRHAVADADESYDFALHNHPHVSFGGQSVYTPYPTPDDLALSRGRNARFAVISQYGVVEWDPAVREDLVPALLATRWGRAVMRLFFPTFYPDLLKRVGVSADLKPWKAVSQSWIDAGTVVR